MTAEQILDRFIVTGMTPVRVAGQEFPNGSHIDGNLLRAEWGDRQLEMIIRAGIIAHEADVATRIDPAWVTDPRYPTAHAPDSPHSLTKWVSAIGADLAEPLPPREEQPPLQLQRDPAPEATSLAPPPLPVESKPLPVTVPDLLDESEDYGAGPGAEMIDVELPPLPGDSALIAPPASTPYEVMINQLADTIAKLAEMKAKQYCLDHPEVATEDLVKAEQAGRNRPRFIAWLEEKR